MNDPRPTLRAARALLAEPGRWTQGALARTAGGSECGALDPDAHTFCTVGAMMRADYGDNDAYSHVQRIIDRYHESDEFDSVEAWNDDAANSRETVLAILDEAIQTEPWSTEG